jgi:hypothetical protein
MILPNSLAASAYTGSNPVAEPQKTQIRIKDLVLLIVLVVAHTLVRNNPNASNGQDEQSDHNYKN